MLGVRDIALRQEKVSFFNRKRRKVKFTERKLRTKENIYSSFTDKKLKSNKIAKKSGCKNIVIRERETLLFSLTLQKNQFSANIQVFTLARH